MMSTETTKLINITENIFLNTSFLLCSYSVPFPKKIVKQIRRYNFYPNKV